ncbi:hypothetical protein Aperf_G00000102440 [Anoplocephala perfoliata]
MNRLKITEIKRRRHEERRQKGLANAALRSPVEHPITYILNNHNRLTHYAYHKHRNADVSRLERVSLTLLPRGHKVSKFICRDGLPKNETSEFPQFYLPVLPRPPSGPLLPKGEHACKAGEVTPQAVIEDEKRDQVIITAIEVISEWTAEEPCFVDPETVYGDRKLRFMDSVMVRLRAFKAAISPSMMEILENAKNACKRIPQNFNVEANHSTNNGTPFQPTTPTGRSRSSAHSVMVPQKSPFVSTYTSSLSAHQRSASRPRIQFRIHENGGHLSQNSSTLMRETHRSSIDSVPQPQYLHEMRFVDRPLHTQNCDFTKLADNPCIFVNRLDEEVDELSLINTVVVHDPTLPRTEDHGCPSCGNKEAVFFHPQTLKADDNMRLYYVRTNLECLHKWTEANDIILPPPLE